MRFRVSTQLMHDQRLGKPVAMTAGFITSRGPQGELDLFHVVTTGSAAGQVRNLQRDGTSTTGWRERDLPARFDAGLLAAQVDPVSQKHVVFAAEANEFAINLFCSTETAPGVWSAWRDLDSASHGPREHRIDALAAEVVGGKQLLLFAIVRPRAGSGPRGPSLWQIAWQEEKAEWTELAAVDDDVLAYANFKDLGEGLVLLAQGNLVHFGIPSGRQTVLANDVGFRRIDVEEKRNGHSIVVFDQASSEGPKPLRFIDRDFSPAPADLPGTERLAVRQILAMDGKGLPFAVYILDDRNLLHVLSRAGTAWDPPFNLGFRYSEISGGLNADGLPEIYGLTTGADRRLECIYKSPTGAGAGVTGSWHRQTLSLPKPELENRPVYVTEIFAQDSGGRPLPFSEIELSASEHIEAAANGRTILVRPNARTRLKSDASGRMTLTGGSTALDAPKWRVWPAGATEDEGQWIDVNDKVFRKVRQLELRDVQALLPADLQEKAKDVHSAVKTAGKAIPTATAAGASTREPGGFRPLDTKLLGGRAWSFRVENGDVAFATLTAAEYERATAAARAGADVLSFDLVRWLSDAAQAIANQVVKDIKYWVREIANGIEATLELIVDNFKYVVSGVIRFVEQVFQFVESVFNAVRVPFEKLFKALGAPLERFQKDVWATKEFLEGRVASAIKSTQTLLDKSRDGVEGYLRGERDRLRTHFDRLLAAVEGKTFDYRVVVSPPPGGYPEARLLEESALVNSMPRKLDDPSAGLGEAIQFSAAVQKILDDLAAGFERFGNAVTRELGDAGEQQLRVVTEWMQQIAENPSELPRATLKALLQTVRQLLDLTLGLSGATLNLLFDLAKTFLNAIQLILQTKIESPLLQLIYDLINPNETKTPLTVGGLLFLVCAAPVSMAVFVFTGRGFRETPAAAGKDERDSLIAAGILRLTLINMLDIGLTIGDTPPPRKLVFFMNLIPIIIAFVRVPGTIDKWSKAEQIMPNVHWLAVAGVPFLRLAIALLPPTAAKVWDGITAVCAFVPLGVGVARIVFDLVNGHAFALLYGIAWLADPVPVIVGPLRHIKPKGLAAAVVIKGFAHAATGAVLVIQNLLSTEAKGA